MRRLTLAAGRTISGLLAIVLAAAVGLLAAAPPAAAHGTLAMSTPAEGATVDQPLATVQLYFTEQVAANAHFTVTAPGGGRVDNGWTYGPPKPLAQPVREYFLVDGKFEPREYSTGFPAVVTIAHLPSAGQYSVSYLSVASDGEAVRGTMSFRYAGPVTAAPQGWQPPTDQPDPSLLAAAEQHGQGAATAVPSVSSAPTPAAMAPSADSADSAGGGGPGRVAWISLAVAIAAALAAVVLWRRRDHPSPAVRATGRARGSGPAPRRSATGSRSTGSRSTGSRSTGSRSTGSRSTGSRSTGLRGTGSGSTGLRPTGEAQPAARTRGRAGVAEGTRAVPATGASPSAADEVAVAGEPRLSNTGLALLVGGLVVALLAGFGLGRLGPADQRTATDVQQAGPAGGGPLAAGQAVPAGGAHQHPAGTGAHTHPGDGGADQTQATGTSVSAAGYTLQPVQRSQPADVRMDYQFRIVGTDRRPATRFAVVHDKPLHMIVVGRDLDGYQHLHPTMAPDGTWSVPVQLARAGGYRIYADFTVITADGTQLPLVLGVDHHVPGTFSPATLPPPASAATAGPFTVAMEGTPTVGMSTPLLFRVSRTGAPVQLERYLGAYGHLVVVREGDLGYVHVHPEPELVDGAVKFWLTAPSTGRYRAFLDFQVDGKVQTAEYTVNLP
ncbi:copper resistance protein CopC [Micromonospora sp. CA-263727]|uniref:copper resistance CopC family protein n=1 Tax=Micromonospora sp. CA-263727 TaxID=3239967 RepID=UPI003D8E2714